MSDENIYHFQTCSSSQDSDNDNHLNEIQINDYDVLRVFECNRLIHSKKHAYSVIFQKSQLINDETLFGSNLLSKFDYMFNNLELVHKKIEK